MVSSYYNCFFFTFLFLRKRVHLLGQCYTKRKNETTKKNITTKQKNNKNKKKNNNDKTKEKLIMLSYSVNEVRVCSRINRPHGFFHKFFSTFRILNCVMLTYNVCNTRMFSRYPYVLELLYILTEEKKSETFLLFV